MHSSLWTVPPRIALEWSSFPVWLHSGHLRAVSNDTTSGTSLSGTDTLLLLEDLDDEGVVFPHLVVLLDDAVQSVLEDVEPRQPTLRQVTCLRAEVTEQFLCGLRDQQPLR